jgi:integrase
MRVPKYSHHKATGQAYVKLAGKFCYLGKYGTAESRRKYEKTIGEYLTKGRQEAPTTNSNCVTVEQLYSAYLEHCREYYQRGGKPTQEYDSHVYLRAKLERIACLSVDQVTPATVSQLRDQWIEVGNSRKFINKSVGRIVRMFKWGVTRELVNVTVWQRLTAIDGLKAGRSKARDFDPVGPADDDDFEAACKQMPDDVAACFRIQRLIGCRPGEMWIMRPDDVDRSGEIWTYVPSIHKTQHHGKQRIIQIGPRAQSLLCPYLLRAAGSLCFGRPTGTPWDRYSYREALHLACENAEVPTINPNQLRHSAGTQVRKEFGLEAAQVSLGHSSADVTQVYAERDQALAQDVARRIG